MMELRISSLFERHTPFDTNQRKKPGLETLPLKDRKRGFIAHSRHFTYKVKLVRGPYLGLFNFLLIQIKSKINKKRSSRIPTPQLRPKYSWKGQNERKRRYTLSDDKFLISLVVK